MTEQYRVISYNVRVAMNGGPNAWPQRVDAVTGTIRHHRPDLVGLQEPIAGQLNDIRECLPTYEWVGVGRDDGDQIGEFSPIGFRRDRFELKETNTFWLSETPDEVGSVGWDADLSRILTWVRLSDRATGVCLLHANTHFSHMSERARRGSAELIVERLADVAVDESIVLTGDLNCEPESPPYRALIGTDAGIGLKDVKRHSRHAHHGPEYTFTGFADATSGRRIDYIFVSSDVDVASSASCTDLRANGSVPSDHLPVVADIEVL